MGLNSDMDTTCTKKSDTADPAVADSCPSETHHCHPDHAKTIKTGANKGCLLNSDMDTTCTKKSDTADPAVADSCPSATHHCHPDHAKAIKTGANKGCTLNSDMNMTPEFSSAFSSGAPSLFAAILAIAAATGI